MTELATRLDAEQYLLGRINYERTRPRRGQFKLDRMRSLLAALQNPQSRYPAVHIAGTKGKGSTAAMVAGCMCRAGYRVGLYTSPHLEQAEERIVLNGQSFSADAFLALVNQVRPHVARMDRTVSDGCGPTYFEIVTAMAMVAFADAKVDIAVLEVGLGGRLDSTNVCEPCVSVITSISYDHTSQLGDSLAQIAREKAGIIKPSVPVVCGVVEYEPLDAINTIALEQQARLIKLTDDFGYRPLANSTFSTHGDFPRAAGLEFWQRQPLNWKLSTAVGLSGDHQLANASVTLATVGVLRSLGWEVSDEQIRSAMAQVKCPARIEIVHDRPLTIIDSAHNVASVRALSTWLDQQDRKARRRLIFATSVDKDVKGMLEQLLPRFEEVFLTQYQSNPRFIPVDQLAATADELGYAGSVQVEVDPRTAWTEVAKRTKADEEICITGSFFLAAELRSLIINWPASQAPSVQPSP